MKMAIIALMAVAILLLGCTYPQPPAQNESGKIVGNDRDSHGCIGSAGYQWCDALQECIRSWETDCTAPAKEKEPVVQTEPKKEYTCALTLDPSAIYAGESASIGFSVQTKDNVKFEYNCGTEMREISTGGLTSGSRLCRFDAPGETQVWIKADGVICAQKTLTVLSREFKPKNCSVKLLEKNLETYFYKMQVDFDGFLPGDNITWKCGYTTAKKPIAGDPAFGMPRQEILSCEFSARPPYDTIPVSMAGVECGEISTR